MSMNLLTKRGGAPGRVLRVSWVIICNSERGEEGWLDGGSNIKCMFGSH